jgi:3-oxoacyl-(acyl-carrier-protein) synthase
MAGGADACGAALVEALADMELLKPTRQARAYESRVPGVFPSEGAVVAVLARSDDAARDGRAGVLRFDGYAAGFEPTLTRAEHSTEGIVATIRRALEVAGRRPQEIGLVMTSAHGTPLDGVEIDAVAEALDGRDEALVLASKDALGEAFGAAGVLSLALVSGLWRARPKLADGVGRSLDGAPLVAGHANRRLDAAAVALNVSVCYSGTVVASIVSRID